jgi:hypothetical protein
MSTSCFSNSTSYLVFYYLLAALLAWCEPVGDVRDAIAELGGELVRGVRGAGAEQAEAVAEVGAVGGEEHLAQSILNV